MSQTDSHAAAFFQEVAQVRCLWTIQDEGGFPAPKNADGQRAQPFWSSEERVEHIVETLSEHAAFIPVEISWEEFSTLWAPALAQDGIRIGLNCTNAEAPGKDMAPDDVRRGVEAHLKP